MASGMAAPPKNTTGGVSKSAVSAPKILRIGVVQAGRIIEEKLIRRPENVTIGSSTRNTVSIFATGLPRSFVLFERSGDRYLLNFGETMDGRMSLKEKVLPLAQVAEEVKAHRRGSVWQIPMDEGSRGKVTWGEVTILFQFVTPPPPRPHPQLPLSVRGGLIQQADWLMTGSFLGCLLIHLAFVLYLRNVDWPKEIAIDQIPDRFVRDIVVERPKPIEKKVEVAAGEGAKKGQEGAKKGKRSLTPEEQAARAEAQARAAAERRARLAEELSRVGALKVLGAQGGRGGAVADLLSRGDPGGDAERAFAGVGGVGVATRGGGGGLTGRGGGGSGQAVGIEGLRGTGPGEVGTGARGAERAVRGAVKDETPNVDGTLDPSVVASEVRRRMGCVKTCYEKALRNNQQLAGKLTICFTIGATGSVTDAHIDADTINDREVGDCCTNCIKRIRFPAPEGGNVDVCFPFVFTASQ